MGEKNSNYFTQDLTVRLGECESLGTSTIIKACKNMNIKLDMPIGKYREFTKEELLELNELLENSSKIF